MIKVEVIENFTLKKFGELKNLVRKSIGKEGELKVGDTFECSEEMAQYLTGDNALKKVVVKVIEIKEEKKTPLQEKVEALTEAREKVVKKKKSSKK